MSEQEKEKSLRYSTEEGLRSILAQLLSTLKDTPSRSVVVRKLTEVFDREVEAIGALCDRMEGRLRAQSETYLSAFKQAVEMYADKVLAGLKQPGDLSVVMRELNELKQAQASALGEIAQQHETFIQEWRLELDRETRSIMEKFHDEGLSVMTEGILADGATERLDTERSSKH